MHGIKLPTLRRELVAAFALVFAGAFCVAITGVLMLLPRFESSTQAVFFVSLLLICDVAVFALFGHYLITRRVLKPIDGLVSSSEAIARGELVVQIPPAETQEIDRLSAALTGMTQRLISDQEQLAANIRSLDETNRLLTEARDAMVHAEKLASAGRLGAGIAHEVGNPLGAIIGYLALLKKQANDKDVEYIESAEREARRIDRIVRGLLDYSRPHDAKSLPLSVNDVIHETVDLVSTQGKFKRVKLELDLHEPLVQVSGDPYQLQQVLVNLFVNAADALEDVKEPCVHVTTVQRKHQKAPPVQARRKDDHPGIDYSHRRRLYASPRVLLGDPGAVGGTVVEIEVTDNGPGLPKDLIDQIFEPFVTTKEIGKGTGLGLAVCQRLIEGMGGVIRAESDEGAGATFRIVLPALTNGASA